MRGKHCWGPGKGRGPCIIRHNLPVITIFALPGHLPVCQTARMFCSIMGRGVSLGVYINNPSYNHSEPLSIVLGNHFTIGLSLIISQYLSVRTYSWLLWQQEINKLLENDSYCIQDKLWSNLGERCGGAGATVLTSVRSQNGYLMLCCHEKVWKVWKLKCNKRSYLRISDIGFIRTNRY